MYQAPGRAGYTKPQLAGSGRVKALENARTIDFGLPDPLGSSDALFAFSTQVYLHLRSVITALQFRQSCYKYDDKDLQRSLTTSEDNNITLPLT